MIYKGYHGSCEVTSSLTSVYSGQSVGKGKMEDCRQDQSEAEEVHHPDPSLSALLSCPQSPWLTTESDSLREVARCQLPACSSLESRGNPVCIQAGWIARTQTDKSHFGQVFEVNTKRSQAY